MLKIISQDGLTEFRHYMDLSSAAPRETSMIPFLDNGHIDKTHKYRVQFQGGHILKTIKKDGRETHKSEKRGHHIQHNPVYTFKKDKGDTSVEYCEAANLSRLQGFSVSFNRQESCLHYRR